MCARILLAAALLLRQCSALAPPAARLRSMLAEAMKEKRAILMPCCYDGVTARLVERTGFELTFMTGFGVSAVHGVPDTQLLGFGEMRQQAALIAAATTLPCIGDGDTGYGNAVNVRRTVLGYSQAGLAGVMIEDQVAPKRCGHVAGKAVVSFEEAVARVRAACDARDSVGGDAAPVIIARTDARESLGLEEAIKRCLAFRAAGADVTFLEAPRSVEEMRAYCEAVPGPKLANMLEHGRTPVLPPAELGALGFAIAAYPLTLLSAATKAQLTALERLKNGKSVDDLIVGFDELKDVVGFTEYAETERRYAVEVQDQ